ncbi:hypothetical protein K458DRAFT_416800 [Lentithecium fluviatile CBS 122367]|uniref:Secreted protein n=1 Tax=Lentithecium fluviatile CBS 122367 TaxID=1168545 RepID=A0A6G1J4W7_9PLEO|nr:hypothetical protein K458DRAFT_416800 [Lentithecium fluviatile CBS 122367]
MSQMALALLRALTLGTEAAQGQSTPAIAPAEKRHVPTSCRDGECQRDIVRRTVWPWGAVEGGHCPTSQCPSPILRFSTEASSTI